MKIAHCIHGLGPGGAQSLLKLVVEGANGFEHHVYTPSGGMFVAQLEGVGAKVRIIPRGLSKLDPLWVLRLAARMREDRVDVVHTHLFGDSLHGVLAARLARTPVVVTLHSVAGFHTASQRFGYRRILPLASRTVACADSVRRSFLDDLGRDDVAIDTIPNGVSGTSPGPTRDAVRRELACGPETVAIAAVGRVVAEKGYDDLVTAFGRVVRRMGSRVRLFLVGDGPLRTQIEEQVRRARLEDSVGFLGFRQDVPRLLPGFDVVAFTSFDEGLPMALLESMAAGRCIVSTDVGGIGDAIRDDAEGILVPSRDVERLADAMCMVAGDANLRARLGAAAVARFRAEFTVDRMVAAYERVYRELHNGGAGPVVADVAVEPVERASFGAGRRSG